MSALEPLETLYDGQQSTDLPLPPALASLYGRLQFPPHPRPPYVIGNFVTTLDGVVALTARAILDTVRAVRPCDLTLLEGGPQLIGDFFAEHLLDELYLTLAPQLAGRDDSVERPGLVAGKQFAPEHPVWGTLVGVKRGGNHLFLRYAFETRA